jgi:hypothetical protein
MLGPKPTPGFLKVRGKPRSTTRYQRRSGGYAATCTNRGPFGPISGPVATRYLARPLPPAQHATLFAALPQPYHISIIPGVASSNRTSAEEIHRCCGATWGLPGDAPGFGTGRGVCEEEVETRRGWAPYRGILPLQGRGWGEGGRSLW